MARPLKPRHLKESQGTLQPCRDKGGVDDRPLSAIPEVPVGLGVVAEGYFVHYCEILMSRGLLVASHVDLIRRAADWKEVYERAKNECLNDAYYQTTQSGYTQVTAHFTVMEKAYAKLLEFEREFGFTLASSQKIVMPEHNKENEFFD